MSDRRIDGVARAMARRGDRRRALATALAMLLGAAGAHEAAAVTSAGIPILSCKNPGVNCQHDKNCCTRKCIGGICACNKRGAWCWQPGEGALCCSGRCHQGKCR